MQDTPLKKIDLLTEFESVKKTNNYKGKALLDALTKIAKIELSRLIIKLNFSKWNNE